MVLTAILFLLFVVSLWLEYGAQKRALFPFVSLVGAYYFLFHGVASSYAAAHVDHLPFPNEVGLPAVVYTVAFASIMIGGYWLGTKMPVQQQNTEPEGDIEVNPALFVTGFGLMALHFAFYFLPVLNNLPSLPQLRAPSWYCAFAIFALLAVSGRARFPIVAIFVVITIAKIVLDARIGQITPIVFTFVILAAVAVHLRRLKWILLCVLLSAVTVSGYGYAKYLSRSIVGDRPTNIFEFTPDASRASIEASLNAAARRSSHALLTGLVMSKTPEPIPYMDSAPVLDAIRNHIPRIVWQEKPVEKRGNEFGHLYQILSADDETTSWNLTWVVDFYTAYGPYIAVVAALLIGITTGGVTRWMSRKRDRVFWFGLHSATVFPLFYQESNFSLMAGSLLWVFAVLYIGHAISRVLVRRVFSIAA